MYIYNLYIIYVYIYILISLDIIRYNLDKINDKVFQLDIAVDICGTHEDIHGFAQPVP